MGRPISRSPWWDPPPVGSKDRGEGGDDDEISLQLYQPSPNPFQSTTRIAYSVAGNGERVEIGIYNVAGRLVRKLVSGFHPAGRHEVVWDGRDQAGGNVSRGVYFLRAYVGGQRIAANPRVLYLR